MGVDKGGHVHSNQRPSTHQLAPRPDVVKGEAVPLHPKLLGTALRWAKKEYLVTPKSTWRLGKKEVRTVGLHRAVATIAVASAGKKMRDFERFPDFTANRTALLCRASREVGAHPSLQNATAVFRALAEIPEIQTKLSAVHLLDQLRVCIEDGTDLQLSRTDISTVLLSVAKMDLTSDIQYTRELLPAAWCGEADTTVVKDVFSALHIVMLHAQKQDSVRTRSNDPSIAVCIWAVAVLSRGADLQFKTAAGEFCLALMERAVLIKLRRDERAMLLWALLTQYRQAVECDLETKDALKACLQRFLRGALSHAIDLHRLKRLEKNVLHLFLISASEVGFNEPTLKKLGTLCPSAASSPLPPAAV